MNEEYDLFDAKETRDRELKRVGGNSKEWMALALAEIEKITIPAEVTGEDIQRMIAPKVGQPHHCNVWGALINTAVRRGLIQKTGRIGQMKKKTSHAHNSPLYRIGVMPWED